MEVHAELLTESKMFCGCASRFGAEPNSCCCPVCLGLPGSLPVMNRSAIEHVVRTATALNCTINRQSIFHRKNYFYPDLPKAYQISQYDIPIGIDGFLDIAVGTERKRIRIRRVHLEEDTGKLLHEERDTSFVDYNRCGIPLMEIVTEPDIHSADEAREYLLALRRILIYIGASDGRMEQGSLRCEPNISVRPRGTSELNAKTELKNLASFRTVQLGVQYEVLRQGVALEKERGLDFKAPRQSSGTHTLQVDMSDLALRQETRRWDEAGMKTVSMRTKEHAHDYRYFPEPDLLPIVVEDEWLEHVVSGLPELPQAREQRYMSAWGLSPYEAGVLADEMQVADYFEACVAAYDGEPRRVANWMQGDWMRLFNAGGRDWASLKMRPEHVAELQKLVDDGRVTGKQAKEIFEEVWTSGQPPTSIVAARGLEVVGEEDQLTPIVDRVIEENPRQVAEIRSGKTGKLNYLMGQVMRHTGGQAQPEVVQRLLRQRLEVE